jgi:hypothetical protein
LLLRHLLEIAWFLNEPPWIPLRVRGQTWRANPVGAVIIEWKKVMLPQGSKTLALFVSLSIWGLQER